MIILNDNNMTDFTVAMLEPVSGLNVGYTARLLKNFGINNLVLISPQADLKEARIYASHGSDVVETATISRFEDVIKQFDIIIGTTAITPSKPSNFERSIISINKAKETLNNTSNSKCLLLGRDTTGLTRNELSFCDMVINLPTGTNYPTLNVSHATAILLWELTTSTKNSDRGKISSRNERTKLVTAGKELASEALIPDYKVSLIENALKRIIGKSSLTSRECTLLLFLFSKSLTTIKRNKKH